VLEKGLKMTLQSFAEYRADQALPPCSRLCHIYRYVEPLSGFGPANIKEVCRWHDLVEGVVVKRIWLPLKPRL
jgi:hypothetical protein